MVMRDKGHYLLIKGSTQQEGVTIINIYTSNDNQNIWSKILTEVKGEIDSSTIIVGDFNTPPDRYTYGNRGLNTIN